MSEGQEWQVRVGDPHNDQIAAAANEQLDVMLKSTRDLRRQSMEQDASDDEPAMMAIIAMSLMHAPGWDSFKFASILAAALMRLTKMEKVAAMTDDQVDKALNEFVALLEEKKVDNDGD